MNRKRFSLLVTLFVAVGLLVGCGSTGGVHTPSEDELILAFGYEPEEGWDPIKGSTHYGTSLFQTGLFKRDIDLNIVEDLAESYELSDDGCTYTVTLRPDIKFSDGSDLTVDDVVFTYQTAKDDGSATVDLSNMKSVKAISDNQVQFELVNADISFLAKMASLGIVPKASYTADYGKNPVGTGPFKFVSWKQGESLNVEPNPYYYGDKVPFKKITFLFVEGDQATVLAKAGQADVIRIPVEQANVEFEGYHLETLKTMDNRGVALPYVPNTGEVTDDNTIAPNSPIGNDVTSDIAIRKALNIAVDRQAIIDGALNGQGTAAYSLCDGTPWFNEDTVINNDGDIETANKMLDDAGWHKASDGIREKNGVRAQFTLWFAYQDRENIALAFVDAAKKCGIDAKAQYASWEEIEPKMYSEPVLFGWGDYNPLELYYNYSSSMRGHDYYNSGYYADDKVDSYLDAAMQSRNLDDCYSNLKKAQWDGECGLSSLGDAPWVWLVNENHLYLVKDGLDIGKQKVQPHGGGWPLLDTISNWKLTN